MVCKALASLDYMMLIQATSFHYFNPQGSREPRHCHIFRGAHGNQFQSTRLSRASTNMSTMAGVLPAISIHKALASLDSDATFSSDKKAISIHKALASLDLWSGKNNADDYRFQSTRLSRASTKDRKYIHT